jgi:hypothetical protein
MFRKCLIGAFVVAAALIAAPAMAAQPADSAEFVLTLSTADDPDRTATLLCDPNGGDHPDADTACGELAQVDGVFDDLNVTQDGVCSMEYDPVRVTATGHWDGTPVAFDRTYGNQCDLAVTTGSVFAIG